MEKGSVHYQTFKKGSKTYFTSSLLFPREIREDVFILYGFVRTADNFVDAIPQDAEGFSLFRNRYREAMAGRPAGDPIIDSFVELSRRRDFAPEWAEAFLYSMELDLIKSCYHSLEETLEYIYGSAEVIGLFMARLMDLPAEAEYPARMLGRAMQYINFIRDIAEDNALGRRYLPLTDTALTSLREDECRKNEQAFRNFHRKQIALYTEWHREAERGYRFIPRKMLIPIKTAEDMYMWTASQIANDPFLVFRRKVKPSRWRILLRGLRNMGTT